MMDTLIHFKLSKHCNNIHKSFNFELKNFLLLEIIHAMICLLLWAGYKLSHCDCLILYGLI